jgi:hypothetical protein
VLDEAVVDVAVEDRRQVDHLPQPVADPLLQLDGGRRGAPEHGVDVEAGGQHLAQDARTRAGDGEVGQEPGMVPVRHVGLDQSLVVVQQEIEGLPGVRRRGGQGAAHVAWKYRRQNGRQDGVSVHPPQVVGDQVGGPVQGRAQLGIWNVSWNVSRKISKHGGQS